MVQATGQGLAAQPAPGLAIRYELDIYINNMRQFRIANEI